MKIIRFIREYYSWKTKGFILVTPETKKKEQKALAVVLAFVFVTLLLLIT